MPFGLSILLDPNLDETFCTQGDSQGFRVLLHPSLQFPQAMDFASGLPLNKEIYIEIQPKVVLIGDDIKTIERVYHFCQCQYLYTVGNY